MFVAVTIIVKILSLFTETFSCYKTDKTNLPTSLFIGSTGKTIEINYIFFSKKGTFFKIQESVTLKAPAPMVEKDFVFRKNVLNKFCSVAKTF
jgi:hypothetical protein